MHGLLSDCGPYQDADGAAVYFRIRCPLFLMKSQSEKRLTSLHPGAEQEELARECGFSTVRHYEIGFRLMGVLLCQKNN